MKRTAATVVGLFVLLSCLPAHAAHPGRRGRASAFEAQLTIAGREGRPAIVFGRVGTQMTHFPAVKVGGRAPVKLTGTTYENSGWEFAARSKAKGILWGVVMWDVEGPGWTYEIVSSADGSRWRHVATIKKPNFNASLVDFSIKADGSGVLVMRLDEGVAPDAAGGLYFCETSDGGKHWTDVQFAGETAPPVDRSDFEAAVPID